MARCIICCFKCCLWCLEKFIKFLNRNAYIMVSSTVPPAVPGSVPLSPSSSTMWASSPNVWLRDLSCPSQIAIYGKNFCVSAKNAFMLLMRNVVRSGCHAPGGSPTHLSHPEAGLRNALCLVQCHAVTELQWGDVSLSQPRQDPHPSLS